MAKKVFKLNPLSSISITALQKQLQEYRDSLDKKCERFVRELAESGISVAKVNTGNFGKYLAFTVQSIRTADGYKAVLLATNTGIIHSEWRTKDGVKTADVSPLLMCEFGSGLRAKNPMNVPGVGTGTFPGGTHGDDPEGWWYMDLDGVWHHSYGMTPKMPMYHASLAIMSNVQRVAKEVFGT